MLLTADRVLIDGTARAGIGIRIDQAGRIARVDQLEKLGRPDLVFGGRLLIAGTVNAHSHVVERLLRGRTRRPDDGALAAVVERLDPDTLFAVARQAFIEMLLAGVTSVGECHAVHHQADGSPYDDDTAMADAVITAAEAAGIRMSLLRSVAVADDARDVIIRRVADPSVEAIADRVGRMAFHLLARHDPSLSWGVSVCDPGRLLPDSLVALKTRFSHVPFHVRASETRSAVEQSIAIRGAAPVELLGRLGILDGLTTLVHAVHLVPAELEIAASTGANVCVSPSTEAAQGLGHVRASELLQLGVPLSLGTGGQTLGSVLEEARRLEMHDRLRLERLAVLGNGRSSPADSVLEAATRGGARALNLQVGAIEPGLWADLVALNLGDPALAGWQDETLASLVAFSADSRAVVDVIVGGRVVVSDCSHPLAVLSAGDFSGVVRRLGAATSGSASDGTSSAASAQLTSASQIGYLAAPSDGV